MSQIKKPYDVVVIGGGPAGMMAAGRAAEKGARVILLEKNPTLGQKLLLTGGGRCNLTNAEFDKNIFLNKFKAAKKFLFSPLSKFGVEETIEFFQQQNLPTKIEAEKRVFPVSDKAQDVLKTMISYMRQGQVEIKTNVQVYGFEIFDKKIIGVRLKDGEVIRAKNFVLATGGKSHPETGSTGDGLVWLKKIGHQIIEPDLALVPIKIKETWVHQLSGLSLSDAYISVWQNNKKQNSNHGKMLFTHFGLSGPLILNMSKGIGQLLKTGPVTLSLDLLPDFDTATTDKKIQEIFSANQNKKIKNSLSDLILPALVETLLKLAEIDSEKFVNKISREERLKLVKLLKNLPMTVQSLMGVENAIVTSGGVDLKEVDFKNMRSKLYPNLFLVGDVLDIERPSGGYSLQLCWTTGFVAGEAAGLAEGVKGITVQNPIFVLK
ncbi:MAG: aminoacetone oxidase family FAD-binding enzyme [Candidatus Uhrbacteria bacterium]